VSEQHSHYELLLVLLLCIILDNFFSADRMAEDNSRRYPPNLRGLLNFCTEYTQNEDAPSTSDISVMSEEVFFIQIDL